MPSIADNKRTRAIANLEQSAERLANAIANHAEAAAQARAMGIHDEPGNTLRDLRQTIQNEIWGLLLSAGLVE